MPTLSAVQIAQYAYNAGARNSAAGQDLTLAVAIALAESGGQTNVTHKNSDSRRTTDYGVWQINGYWHADLIARGNWSDPAYNAQMMWIIKTKRGGWSQWSTFKSGSFFKHMPTAIRAAEAVQKSGGTAQVPSGNAVDPAANMDSDSTGLATITDPHTWLRLAMISAGGVMIIAALLMLGWNDMPDTAKTIAKAVVLKKVPLK